MKLYLLADYYFKNRVIIAAPSPPQARLFAGVEVSARFYCIRDSSLKCIAKESIYRKLQIVAKGS